MFLYNVIARIRIRILKDGPPYTCTPRPRPCCRSATFRPSPLRASESRAKFTWVTLIAALWSESEAFLSDFMTRLEENSGEKSEWNLACNIECWLESANKRASAEGARRVISRLKIEIYLVARNAIWHRKCVKDHGEKGGQRRNDWEAKKYF